MFKRWIKLLVVMLLIAVGVIWYGNYEFDQAYVIINGCSDYLEKQDDSWTLAGDPYYWGACAYENPVSDFSMAVGHRDLASQWRLNGLMTALFVSLALFLSFLIRWLITGKVRW